MATRASTAINAKPAKPVPTAAGAPAAQLNDFIDKFDPEVAARIRSIRAALRKRLPTALELVYDNYNFLAIGYAATEKPSTSIVSIAAGSKGVALSFYYGSSIPDPDGLLLGNGNQNRFIRLPNARTLAEAGVEALIQRAIDHAKVSLPTIGRGATIIKSISAKQRPRRAK